MHRVNPEPRNIVLRENAGAALQVEVKTGAQWSSRMQAGPFIFNVLPQFAIWTEDDAGNLVETLYITGAGSSKDGRPNPATHRTSGRRANTLQVYGRLVEASA